MVTNRLAMDKISQALRQAGVEGDELGACPEGRA
jgi:hypothetical protein